MPPTVRTRQNGKSAKATLDMTKAAFELTSNKKHGEVGTKVLTTEAFHALWLLPTLFSVSCIVAGLIVSIPVPDTGKVSHPLLWYDRYILRVYGPLVPMMILGYRIVIQYIDAMLVQRNNTSPRPCLALASLLVQLAVITARLLIYQLHVASQPYFGGHVVSDHIFLGLSMVCCFTLELMCMFVDAIRTARIGKSLPLETALALGIVCTTFFLVCTSADMLFTAAFYHALPEVVTTIVVGLAGFQLPLVGWLYRVRTSIRSVL